MKINRLKINYNGIKLATIKFNNMLFDNIKGNFNQIDLLKCSFSIDNIEKKDEITLNIQDLYLIENNFFDKKIIDFLNPVSKKIVKYLSVIDFITNDSSVDLAISIDQRYVPISYANIFAERNLLILTDLFSNYLNGNIYICYYLLRDIIENIKLYLYFLKGAYKETRVCFEKSWIIKQEKDEKIEKTIIEGLSNGCKEWKFNTKELVENIYNLKKWNKELQNISKINDKCNSYIHKNGLKQIIPNLNKSNFSLNDVFYTIKFFLTLIICYDGKVLVASDYFDSIEEGVAPVDGSQYWIARIFSEFIKEEYCESDIEKLKEQSYMEIL